MEHSAKDVLDLDQIRLQEMLDRIHLILTQPNSAQSWLMVQKDYQLGKSRLSKITKRFIESRLKRAVASEKLRTYTPVAGTLYEQRRTSHRLVREAYKKGGEVLLKHLKSKYDWNLKNGKVSCTWSLTSDEIDQIFNSPVMLLGQRVLLKDIGPSCCIRRIDKTKGFQWDNIEVTYRRPRVKREDRKPRKARKKSKNKVLWRSPLAPAKVSNPRSRSAHRQS